MEAGNSSSLSLCAAEDLFEDPAARIDAAGGLGGDDFKCTGGIKMAFLIPCKSNKPHPFEIPLAPPPELSVVCQRMLIELSSRGRAARQNANDRSSCAGSHKCHCFTF